MAEKKKKKWIESLEKGGLHRSLGIPEGQDIPEEKVRGALKSKDKKERKQAQAALVLKKFHPAAKKKSGAELLYGSKPKEKE